MVGRGPEERHHSKDACIEMKGNHVKEVLAEASGLDLARINQEVAWRGHVGLLPSWSRVPVWGGQDSHHSKSLPCHLFAGGP